MLLDDSPPVAVDNQITCGINTVSACFSPVSARNSAMCQQGRRQSSLLFFPFLPLWLSSGDNHCILITWQKQRTAGNDKLTSTAACPFPCLCPSFLCHLSLCLSDSQRLPFVSSHPGRDQAQVGRSIQEAETSRGVAESCCFLPSKPLLLPPPEGQLPLWRPVPACQPNATSPLNCIDTGTLWPLHPTAL